ncbi:hypothetical protein [Companilactobacillus furfuricola]|uniref:hypothetical protein n=1 Tax=Companilactobacillus furfuricola TaxID=1462575 RepID=UPI000F778B4B|nr:hypothetical protein [Companilactobacillus furfuricola]
MKRLKGCISLIVVLFGITSLFLGSNIVQAKVVTDDAGDQVDIPDKYFLDSYDSSVDDNDQKIWTYLWPFVNEWVNNPDTKMSDIRPMMSKLVPDMTTFNDLVEKYSTENPKISKDLIEYGLKEFFTQKYLPPSASSVKTIDRKVF